MSAIHRVLADDSISVEEKLARLQELNEGLAESLQKLAAFQNRVLTIKRSATVDEALELHSPGTGQS